MRITPNHIAIGRIFEQNFLFEVPKYQRYYAWDEEQVKDYIKDLDNILTNSTPDNPLEHFFGGIVCASKTVEGSNRQQKELIDGQQRITTTILLIVNIIKKYEELKTLGGIAEEDMKIIDLRITKLQGKYIVYQDEINRRPITVHKLVLSLADKHFFENILDNRPATPTRNSHQRIATANSLLEKYVQQKVDNCGTITEKLDLLDDIESALYSRSTVIFMDCDSRASAYKLFQVLNDRGAGLNEGDLLKSKTLEALEEYPREQESAQEFWDEILQEEPNKVENFLRTYFASCQGKRAGKRSLYDDFLKAFFPTLFIGENSKNQTEAQTLLNTINNILLEIRNYRKITSGEWPYEAMQPITDWDRNRLAVLVKFLSYDITVPLLLAATHLDHKKFATIVHTLEKFMFRYKTICGNGHQVLSELYNDEAKKIRNDPTGYSYSHLFSELRRLLNEKANDEVFKVQLKNLYYASSGGNKSLRYFFSTLCDYYKWHENGEVGKPKANKETIINYDNVTIEHIDSQNQEGTRIFSGEDVHKFMNLTILSQNDNGQRVNNKPFAEKKVVYQASCYRINQKFAAYSEWSTQNADDWQHYVVDLACKVFVIS